MRVPSVFRGLPRTFWVLWGATLVDRLGGFAFAFLTLYLTGERHLRVDEAAAILSLGGLGGLLGSLAGGVLADHLGRKATLVWALGSSGALMLLLGLVRDPWAIAGLWLAYGIASGAARPASSALLADVVPAADRLRAFGLLHWAINIGFAIAPVVGGLLAHRTFTGLFLADGATTLVTVALVATLVPGAAPPQQHEPAWRGVTQAFRDGPYAAFLACMVVAAAVYAQAESSMPVDMVAHGLSTETYGLVIAVNGILITVLSPVLAGVLARAEPMRVLVAATALTGVGFGLNAVATSAPAYAAGVAVWTLGEIMSTPATGALVANLAPPAQRGRYSGAFTMSWSLARFIGPPAGGAVLAHLGAAPLWLGCLGLGLLTAGALAGLGGPLRRRLGA